MRIKVFVLSFLFKFTLGGMTLLSHPRPPGGLASRPLPPIEQQHKVPLKTATFALG